jgi:hypothetical protein
MTEVPMECSVSANVDAVFTTNEVSGSGKRCGYNALDAARAVKQSGNFTGIDVDPIIQSYGYSGGSWGGLWSSALQPTYAPDVKITGTAIGGLLPNVTGLACQ